MVSPRPAVRTTLIYTSRKSLESRSRLLSCDCASLAFPLLTSPPCAGGASSTLHQASPSLTLHSHQNARVDSTTTVPPMMKDLIELSPSSSAQARWHHSTAASPAVRPRRRLTSRCLRALAVVVTSVTFCIMHQKCTNDRAASARQLACQRHGAPARRQAVFDVDVDEADKVVCRQTGVTRCGSCAYWRQLGKHLDWCVVGAGAVVCSAV